MRTSEVVKIGPAVSAPPVVNRQSERASETGVAALPSLPRRVYLLVLVTLVAAVSMYDRQVITILVEPIRQQLALSDTQIGLLTGIAFTLVYTFAALPIARVADRGSRRKIIAVSMMFWSAMTAACGLAQSFVQLFLARTLVGLGETGGGTPTHALLSDAFPRTQRGTAMAFYLFGTPLGTAGGLAFGGWVLSAYGWRAAFYVAGVPGIVLALLLLFTTSDVAKGAADGVKGPMKQPPLRETMRALWSIRTLPLILAGASLQALLGTGLASWAPAFLMRVHGMHAAQVGVGLGTAMGLGSLIGHSIGGPLSDWLGRKDVRYHVWIGLGGSLAAGIVGALAFLLPAAAAIPLIGVVAAVTGVFAAPMVAIMMTLAPVTARATVSGCSMVLISIVALGLGPALVGMLSDLLRPSYGVQSLRFALLSFLIAAVPAAWLFYLAGRYYPEDLATAEARLRQESIVHLTPRSDVSSP